MSPRVHRLLYPTPSPLAEVSTSITMTPIATLCQTSLSCSLLTRSAVTAYQLLQATIVVEMLLQPDVLLVPNNILQL